MSGDMTSRAKPPLKRLAALLVSGGLMLGLYRQLDVAGVGAALVRVDWFWLMLSVGMIVPMTFLRAVRFFWVAPPGALPGVGEAFRLTLVASALNVFLPAKTGDLVKSYFIARHTETSGGVAIAIVVYERLCDLFALVSLSGLAWLVARPEAPVSASLWWLAVPVVVVCGTLITSDATAGAAHRLAAVVLRGRRLGRLGQLAVGWPHLLQSLRGRRRWIVAFSLGLWLTHLVQIWLFTVALSLGVPGLVCASLTAVALMAGQLPLTVAGIGTRDVALVVLLSRYVTAESAAALGVLVSTRNLLPPLMGLPVMRPYLRSIVGEARQWRVAEPWQ